MDDDESTVVHVAPLDADNIPNENQTHICQSCEEPFSGLYCAACGQKNDDYRRSIFSLLWETVSSITAIEGRIWRTGAVLLLKPGKVAREFADGARMKWTSPVRAYLAMSLLLFGYLSVFNINIISLDVDLKPKPCVVGAIADLPVDQTRLVISPRFFETTKTYEARLESRDMALIEKRLIHRGMGFTFNIDDEVVSCPDGSEATDKTGDNTIMSDVLAETQQAIDEAVSSEAVQAEIKAAKDAQEAEIQTNPTEGDDVSATPPLEAKTSDQSEPLANNDYDLQINDREISPETMTQFGLMFLRNPSRLNRDFASYIPRLMFFMMPLTMLIGAMFIRGRGNALLFDHLVHASYVHAVTYFLLFLALVLSQIFPNTDFVGPLFLGLMIYLPLSAKRMFSRGWIKTVWTAYGVGFIYIIVLFVGLVWLMSLQLDNTLSELDALGRISG